MTTQTYRDELEISGIEAEVISICQALLCDAAPDSSRISDPIVRDEVQSRLEAVGFRLGEADGRLWAVARAEMSDPETGTGYGEVELAALAHLAICLIVAPAPSPGSARARLRVDDFHREFAAGTGWSKGWLRRAVLGPLERDRFVRVVAPGQRRSDEFIEAGPRLRLIDTRRLSAAIEALEQADKVA